MAFLSRPSPRTFELAFGNGIRKSYRRLPCLRRKSRTGIRRLGAQLFGAGRPSLGEFSRSSKRRSQIAIPFNVAQLICRFTHGSLGRAILRLSAFDGKLGTRQQSPIAGYDQSDKLVPATLRHYRFPAKRFRQGLLELRIRFRRMARRLGMAK